MWKTGHSKMDQAGEAAGGGGASAAAPAATPAGSDKPAQWDDFLDHEEIVETPPTDPKSAAAPATAAPATPPAAPAAKAGAAATPPEQQQPAQQPPAQQSPAQQQPPKTPTQEELQAQVKQAREQMVTELTTLYTTELSDEDRADLVAAPEKVVPKLVARAVADAVNLAMGQVHQALPHLMQQFTARSSAAQSAWKVFDTAHPDLAKPEYRPAVLKALETVKATHPNLTQEEAVKKVGKIARSILDLPEPQGSQQQPAAAGAGSTPAGGESGAPAAPHVPVARGRAQAAPGAQAEPNEWDQFL